MSEDPSKGLAEGWEAVTDDSGRTYWWNTETNDTTWEKPVAIVAKTGLAAGYLSKVQSDTKVGGSKDELEAARKAGRSGGGAVSARLAQLKQKSEAEKPAAPSRGANGKVEEVEEQFKDPAVFFDGSMVGNLAVGRSQELHYGRVLEDKAAEAKPSPPAEASRLTGASSAAAEPVEPKDEDCGDSSNSPLDTGRKTAMSVEAMRKLQEAKKFLNEKESTSPAKATVTPRDARAKAPPKVDLYS